MKKTLLFNIGNRHILYKNKTIDKDNLRDITRQLLTNYQQEAQYIETQIVDPLIREFIDEIAEIVLFVTDQGKSAYTNQDTLFVGEIVKKKIEERYRFKNINIKKFEGNPTEFEELFPYYTRFLKNYKNDNTQKIICNSGGTPQMKQSLLLLATNILPLKDVEAYQVDQLNEKIISIDLSSTLKIEFIKNTCLEFINNYEYAAIISLINKNQIKNTKLLTILLPLLYYGKHRLTFDFSTANIHLEKLEKFLSSLEFKTYQILKININKRSEKIIELYQNLLIQWEKENYVDFLSRLFRFEEETYYFFVEKKLNYSLDGEKNRNKFLNYIATNQGIKNELKQQKYKGSDIALDKVAKPLLFYFLDIEPKYRAITRKLERVGKYLNLKRKDKKEQIQNGLDFLRNKSIAAHGFEPISRSKIEEFYPVPIENLFTDLEFIVNKIKNADGITESKPATFKRLNELLVDVITEV